MKTLLTTVILFITYIGVSQTTIKKPSIDSGGDSVTRNTINVVYTIGEINIQEATSGTILVSEGFLNYQSLFANEGTTKDHGIDRYTELKIHPNPTADIITIDFFQKDTYTISVLDYSGKKIATFITDQTNQYTIDMENYSSGVYLILITGTRQAHYKSYRILKE